LALIELRGIWGDKTLSRLIIKRAIQKTQVLTELLGLIQRGEALMKSTTQKTYFERIERVVSFLSNQVDNNPSLATLAAVAAISPFHFHRVYRAVTGETPSGTLRRLRLAKACVLLKDRTNSVTQVAFDVGYDSSQSFATAFRSGTGFSPTELRQNTAKLDEILNLLSSPEETTDKENESIEVKVVSLEPFKVIASRHLGPHKGLFTAYGELFNWAEKTDLVEKFKGIYGIPIDDPRGMPEKDCRFDCCFDFGPDAAAGSGFTESHLGGGEFAVARHIGPYDGLEDKYDYLFGPWLNGSGYSLREQAFFNHYLQDPDTVPPEEWETDIYVPVEKTP
jgi:AraC family transcriptional regulator